MRGKGKIKAFNNLSSITYNNINLEMGKLSSLITEKSSGETVLWSQLTIGHRGPLCTAVSGSPVCKAEDSANSIKQREQPARDAPGCVQGNTYIRSLANAPKFSEQM